MALGRPIVTGIKSLAVRDGAAFARREAAGGGWETYEVPLPAVLSVKEGLNLPRYPSVPGRLRAKRKEIERVAAGAGREHGPARSRPADCPRRRAPRPRSWAAVRTRRRPSVDLLVRIGVLAS